MSDYFKGDCTCKEHHYFKNLPTCESSETCRVHSQSLGFWVDRAKKAEARIAELEDTVTGLEACADSLHFDNLEK